MRTSSVIVYVDEQRRLDGRAVAPPLGERLEVTSARALPPGRAQLSAWGEDLLLLTGDQLLRTGGSGVPHQWAGPRTDLAVAALGGGVGGAGGPAVCGRDGSLHLGDGGAPVPLDAAPWWPGWPDWRSAAATAIGDGLVLCRQFGPASTELVDLTGAGRGWRVDGVALGMVAAGGRLVEACHTNRTQLRCRNLWTGDLEQVLDLGAPILDLVAVVDAEPEPAGEAAGPVIWVAVAGERLLAVDPESGTVVADHVVPGVGVVTGAVTPAADLVLCSGAGLTVVDLLAAAVTIQAEFVRHREPLHATAGFTRVTGDGRVLFSDRNHRLWAVRPEQSEHPELIAGFAAPITGLEIGHRTVAVLSLDGRLTTLGDPAA